MRPRIDALKDVNTQLLNGLERYTLTLAQAHGDWLGTRRQGALPKETLQEARKKRALLRMHLTLLAQHGLLALPAPPRTKKRSHTSLALELIALCSFFRTHWHKVKGHTALTLDQIAEAEGVGSSIVTALGKQKAKTGNPERRRAVDLRARAFTLFLAAYDEARRAVTFLLWHQGNADEVVPSLYKTRYQ